MLPVFGQIWVIFRPKSARDFSYADHDACRDAQRPKPEGHPLVDSDKEGGCRRKDQTDPQALPDGTGDVRNDFFCLFWQEVIDK